MTKSSLIRTLALQNNLLRNDAEVAVNTVFDAITESLRNGNRVEIRGFGSFGIKQRHARDGRNPKTGDDVHVDAKQVMFFKAGKELRVRVDS